LVEKLAGVLQKLGCKHGFVVHGSDGMDEMTLTGETLVAEVSQNTVTISTVTPEQHGFTRCEMAALKGGDAVANALIIKSVLAGELGPKRDIVLLNAAYALVAAGKATTPAVGIEMAGEAIDSGRALQQLEKLAALTASY
jgi:anthranilate phosphoribosyltransferase